MDVSTESIGFIVDPVTFIDISINMYEFSMTMSPVVFPLSFVASTIRPYLDPISITKTTYPLPLIGSSSFESVKRSFLSLALRIVFLIRYCFTRFI